MCEIRDFRQHLKIFFLVAFESNNNKSEIKSPWKKNVAEIKFQQRRRSKVE